MDVHVVVAVVLATCDNINTKRIAVITSSLLKEIRNQKQKQRKVVKERKSRHGDGESGLGR